MCGDGMGNHKNCPNCAAPYDLAENRCPYCGTAYFDMSTVDFDNREPFYLKIKVNGYMITQLVVPETCAFSSEEEKVEGRGGLGNVVIYQMPISTKYLTHLGFAGIAQKDGTVVVVEGPEADT